MVRGGRRDLVIPLGATWRLPMRYVQGRGGPPVDLSGCTALMQIRATQASATPIAELTTANGRIVLGGTDGTIGLLLPREVTEAIEARKGVYDLMLDWPGGERWQLLWGDVTFRPVVSRDG